MKAGDCVIIRIMVEHWQLKSGTLAGFKSWQLSALHIVNHIINSFASHVYHTV